MLPLFRALPLFLLVGCGPEKEDDTAQPEESAQAEDSAAPAVDEDRDGYSTVLDCDDQDPDVNPGAEEVPWDGVDNDCDPTTPDQDVDGDGWVEDDCDDSDPTVNPGQAEQPYNGVDDDCNPATLDDDLDEDGHGIGSLCGAPRYAELRLAHPALDDASAVGNSA